jgi:hypothetical protein
VRREIKSEKDAAAEALMIAAEKANSSLMVFSGWLVGGIGATLALLFSNLEKVFEIVDVNFVKLALALLLVALLISTISRLMSSMISAGIESNEKSLLLAAEIAATGAEFKIDIFMSEFARGLFPFQRWWVRKSMSKAKQGDTAATARSIAKLSQAQAMLVFFEVLLVVLAGGLLLVGIRL